MRKTCIGLILVAMTMLASCSAEKQKKDRRGADDMFGKISALVSDYTQKVSEAKDSASWADACSEFEEKLDKINFSYPPDTDILLTEGQNDTIQSLIQEYVNARDLRIQELLHPIIETDSIADSLAINADNIPEIQSQTTVSHSGASRSPGN
ncbi:MAG: hypothetical protein K2K25_05430 [Muribaculaceae bacterium]|nr:hypothetical protein [Muribaculaceae bacterium]